MSIAVLLVLAHLSGLAVGGYCAWWWCRVVKAPGADELEQLRRLNDYLTGRSLAAELRADRAEARALQSEARLFRRERGVSA